MENLDTDNYDISEEEEEVKCNTGRQLVSTVFRGMGKAGDSFLSGMAVAMRETGKHARVTRLKMKLPKLQHRLQKLYLTLGRAVYEQIKQDEEDILEQETIVGVVDQLKECKERIAQVKVRVAEVKEAARAEVQEAVENGDLDLEALFDLVRNGGDEQRYSAVSNVAQLLDDEGTVPVLVGALGDRNPRVRLCALRGLYKRNTEESMNFLLDALSDDHPDVRGSAATYLGWEGNTAFSDNIARLLKDDDDQVRKSAAIALGNLAPEEDPLVDTLSNRVEPLMNALSDEDVGVRQQTVIALRRITHQFFSFRASSSETERAQAIDRWASWWADHQEALTEEQPITAEPDICDEEAAPDQEKPGESEPEDDKIGGLRLIRNRAIELGADTSSTEETAVEAEAEESEEETQEEEAPVEEVQLDETPVEVETEESEEETQEEEIPVEAETEQEQDDADTVTAFMNERCEFIPEARVERKVLYAAYEDYCASRGLDATNRIECYSQIREYSDIDEENEGRGYYFTGVQLRED